MGPTDSMFHENVAHEHQRVKTSGVSPKGLKGSAGWGSPPSAGRTMFLGGASVIVEPFFVSSRVFFFLAESGEEVL